MTDYLVTLKPIDSYFFGGKETFGEGKEDSLKNYLVNSEKFPQQTTVLGMIRKELLKITGKYRSNFNKYHEENIKIADTIGNFKLDLSDLKESNNTDIGHINSISPVLLYKKDEENKNKLEIYTQIPFNYQKNSNKTALPLKFEERHYLQKEEKEKIDTYHTIYNPKDYKTDILFQFLEFSENNEKFTVETKNINESKNFVKYKDIFIENTNIGINISKNNTDNEDGFYKQTSYKLKRKDKNGFKLDEEWGFFFVLSLKDNKDLEKLAEKYTNIVNMGAENSSFKLDIQKINSEIKLFGNLKFEENTITLMSDMYLTNNDYNEIRKNSLLIHAELKNFATIDLENFNHKDKLDNQYKFLTKGSVIHFKENKKLEIVKILNDEKYEILKKIGYNQYMVEGDKK